MGIGEMVHPVSTPHSLVEAIDLFYDTERARLDEKQSQTGHKINFLQHTLYTAITRNEKSWCILLNLNASVLQFNCFRYDKISITSIVIVVP